MSDVLQIISVVGFLTALVGAALGAVSRNWPSTYWASCAAILFIYVAAVVA